MATTRTAAPTGGTISERLARVRAALPPIPKDDRGAGISYPFRGIERIVDAIHATLSGEGVGVHPHRMEVLDSHEIPRTNDRGQPMSPMSSMTLRVTYRFLEPGGSHLDTQTIGHARDTSDKVANKAMTAAYKYALVQTLQIRGGGMDDPDYERPGEEQPGGDVPPKAAPAPEGGWRDWDEHNETMHTLQSAAAALSPAARGEFRAWWERSGWRWPLSRHQAAEYATQVKELRSRYGDDNEGNDGGYEG